MGRKLVQNITKEELEAAVADANKLADVVQNLGFAASNNTSHKISLKIRELGISTLHFNNWNAKASVPTELLLVKGSSRDNQTIKKRIIKENILPYECVICGNIGQHNNKPLVLHLDHIDGDSTNNQLENLRFLCPNCHSQTDTYGGRNIRKSVPSG